MRTLHAMSHLRPVLLARKARPLVDPSADAPVRKTAAVAAILRDGSQGVEVLLIRRADREGDPWSGQMALPGGRHDATDTDLLHTAMRETREEVGLHLEQRQLVSPLDDLEAVARGRRTGLVIRPYVFHLEADSEPVLTPNYEVAETLWAPLVPIHQGQWDTHRPYSMGGQTWKLPAWDVRGRVVWGLTHRILSDLLGRV